MYVDFNFLWIQDQFGCSNVGIIDKTYQLWNYLIHWWKSMKCLLFSVQREQYLQRPELIIVHTWGQFQLWDEYSLMPRPMRLRWVHRADSSTFPRNPRYSKRLYYIYSSDLPITWLFTILRIREWDLYHTLTMSKSIEMHTMVWFLLPQLTGAHLRYTVWKQR